MLRKIHILSTICEFVEKVVYPNMDGRVTVGIFHVRRNLNAEMDLPRTRGVQWDLISLSSRAVLSYTHRSESYRFPSRFPCLPARSMSNRLRRPGIIALTGNEGNNELREDSISYDYECSEWPKVFRTQEEVLNEAKRPVEEGHFNLSWERRRPP